MEIIIYTLYAGYKNVSEIIDYLELNGTMPKGVVSRTKFGVKDCPNKDDYLAETMKTLTTSDYNRIPLDFYEAFGMEDKRPVTYTASTDYQPGLPVPKFNVGDVVRYYGGPIVITERVWSADDPPYQTQRPAHWHYRSNNLAHTFDERDLSPT